MYAGAPTMGIADGVDEVHKATVARNVLKGYRPHEGYWPTEYIPAKREAAWAAFRPRFDADPELLALAEGYRAYLAKRRRAATGRAGVPGRSPVDGRRHGPGRTAQGYVTTMGV